MNEMFYLVLLYMVLLDSATGLNKLHIQKISESNLFHILFLYESISAFDNGISSLFCQIWA